MRLYLGIFYNNFRRSPIVSLLIKDNFSATMFICLVQRLKTFQKTGLEKMCGEEDSFRGDIDIAPLELSKEPREYVKLDLAGSFHHRKEIADIFTKQPSKTITYTQLFEEAEKEAQRSAPKSLSGEAALGWKQNYTNRVFVSGEPGIGKSVLSKVLVQKMLNPNIKLYEPEFIFYIKFRDLSYTDSYDLLEFLAVPNICFSREEQRIIVDYLQNCKNVCIVMDGLDEADIIPKTPHPKCNIFKKAKAATFIKDLFFGDLFPFAKIIVTSRPRQLAQLSDDLIPHSYFIVNLLGLNDEGQRQICSSICYDNAAQRDKILDYLGSHPDLKSYCYVPINAIVTMRILKETKEDEWSKLSSLTSILVTALYVWFLHKLNHFQAREIAIMAFEGFYHDRYHFTQWDINKTKVDFKNLMTFMINVKFSLLDGKEIHCYFAHLMWQELFVAIKLILYTDAKTFADFISKLNNFIKYEVVLKFLFGLCNEDTQRKLLGRVRVEGLNSSTDRTKCKQELKNFAIQNLRDSNSRDFKSLVQIFGWIYEMRDDVFTVQAVDCLNNFFDLREGQVLPTDIPCLNYMFRNRSRPITLELDRLSFVGNTFQYLIKGLSFVQVSQDNISTKFRLCDSVISITSRLL